MLIRHFLLLIPAALILTTAACSQPAYEPPPTRSARHTMPPKQPALPVQPTQPTPPPLRTAPPVQPTPQGAIPAISAAKPKPEIASHETTFDAKEENRANNIRLAAKAIHGHVVQPGKVFSYNETVGPTNKKRGYEKSTVYVEGEKKQGVGGGVCQVSTTLFNAAQEAGMTILERHDHSLPVTYAQSGKEAATSYGGIDFKFKNEKDYAVVIHAAVKDGEIEVAIIKA